MTAVTATVSDKLDFEDKAKIKSVLETAFGTTTTDDKFVTLQGANNKVRVVKFNIN